MKTVIFRHNANPLGTFPASLQKAGADITLLDTWRDDVPADFDALAPDLLVVMGGAPAVDQTDLYPFLRQELAVLEKRLAADLPTLGICLGAQLMSKALGARNYHGREIGQGTERGWYELKVNEAGLKTPIRHLDAGVTRIAQSHQDTFDLPAGATLLASTSAYPNQVFSHGRNALAIQCHPEADETTCRGWYVSYAGAVKDRAEMDAWRADTEKYLPAMKRQSETFLTEWVTLVRTERERKFA